MDVTELIIRPALFLSYGIKEPIPSQGCITIAFSLAELNKIVVGKETHDWEKGS